MITQKGSESKKYELNFSDCFCAFGMSIHVSPSLHKAFLLLSGYACENLIKALLVLTKPHLMLAEGPKIDKEITEKPHDILKLSQKVGIDWHKYDHDLLNFVKKLSIAITWQSRYPVPKSYNTEEVSKNSNIENDSKIVEQIYKIIWRKIEKACQVENGVLMLMPRQNWPPEPKI